MAWTLDDVKNLGTGISGISSGIGAASSIASGISDAINSVHSQRQASRQANRLKNDLQEIQDEYLAALDANDDDYVNALNGIDYDSLYDISNYGYKGDDAYDPDSYIDKEAAFITNQVVDEANGRSALAGLGHSSGALAEAAAQAVAKNNELRESARADALAEQNADFNRANTLMSNAATAKDKYLSALESVMNRNDDIAGAKQSGSSSIATNYRQMMANA